MPLIIHEKINSGAQWAVWKTEESTAEALLLAQLSKINLDGFQEISLEKRKREWLFTRLLLQRIRPTEQLLFRANGQPYLSTEYLSISHGPDLAGIIVSKEPVGIDIEVPTEQVVRICKRFSHPLELERLPVDEEEKKRYCTTLWSGKEAIFKCFGEQVHFAQDIVFEPFQKDDAVLIAKYTGIHGKRDFALARQLAHGHLLVYTL
jgi:4'-phosphopantetheinyl transferase